MNNKLSKITGWSFIIGAILVNIPYYLLIVKFNYPEILRESPDKILTTFYNGGDYIIYQWLAFSWFGLPILIGIILLHKIIKVDNPILSNIGVIFGVFAIIFQLVGLLRWVFVVPVLSEQFMNPSSSAAAKESAIIAFQVIHQYGGVLIGEHLGQLFTIVWTVIISISMFRSTIFKKWLGWFGILLSIIYLFAQTELLQTVLPNIYVLSEAGMIGSILWLIWLIIIGVYLIQNKISL